MHVCFANLMYEGSFESAEELLRHRPLHGGFADALSRRGHRVDLVCLFDRSRTLDTDFGTAHFVRPGRWSRAVGRFLSTLRNGTPSTHTPALGAVRRVLKLDPDLVHWHGSGLHLNHLLLNLGRRLKRASGGGDLPVIAHYHGGYPSSSPTLRAIQRYNLHRIRRLLFTTDEQVDPFVRNGLVDEPDRIEQVMEVSSTFRRSESPPVSPEIELDGAPAVLSVARLDPVKDPLTALRGFELAVERTLPNAVLHLCYRGGRLEREIRTYLADRPALEARVRLHGRIPHERMENVYNQADILLQTSRREFSGYAVVEAMACGTVPVVTDLSSFRVMTDGGRIGRLVPTGDADAVANALGEVGNTDLASEKDRTHAHFLENLSYDRLAEQLEEIYLDVLEA